MDGQRRRSRREPGLADLPTPDPRTEPRAFLRALFDAAVAQAVPGAALAAFLPPPPRGRTLVLGAGKAGGAMAAALDALWPRDAPMSGLVVTRYDYVPPAFIAARARGETRIEVVEAAHPVPDDAGRRAAGRILALAHGLSRRRPRHLPDVGRRIVAARVAGRRRHLRREAGDQQRAAAQRRGDRRDELRQEAPLGDQGRAARGGVRAGARRHAGRERRARRLARR